MGQMNFHSLFFPQGIMFLLGFAYSVEGVIWIIIWFIILSWSTQNSEIIISAMVKDHVEVSNWGMLFWGDVISHSYFKI